MNKNVKLSLIAIAVSLFMAKQASAANTWTEARNDAMGGTGVASANYGSGVLLNPALLAKAKPEDNITVVLPAVGVQITDKDNLQDEIDDISDKVDYYDEVVDNLTLGQILFNPRGVLNQFQGAARDLADELEYLNGKTARANAGAGLAVSIPGQTLSVAFIAKGYAHGRVSSSIDQNDIQYLRDIQHDERVALREAGRAALLGSDEITKHLNSTASGRVAIVSDYGIALAKQFVMGEVPVSIGVTPKLQKTWLYNYTTSIYNYDSSDWNSSRYRNDDTRLPAPTTSAVIQNAAVGQSTTPAQSTGWPSVTHPALNNAPAVKNTFDLPTWEELTDIRDTLNTAIDKELSRTTSDALFLALRRVKADLNADINTRLEQSARIIQRTPDEVLPALVLAATWFDNAARDADIIRRNAITHPGFVPVIPLKVPVQ
ncbi:TPA: conjugal transfer protein TraF [Salmonella enterica subsp. enterica serovar Horsham]|nr:hypothetical protein [Salmonella enterica]EDR3141369.1 hypothetical protein [Salmonella enterica subsp. enterica serovar Horsham]EAS1874373.1 hypothetical protein [Salmonella enterica]EAX2434460.1 hypothetical protein [Salmonella enterica]EAY0395823.1 hypothetical protein [Salmonella enterica]